jgi:DNA ligase-associated metallophosphoesterase
MEGRLSIPFCGVDLHLLPEHAVWCTETETVWIADLHLGKEQTFRNSGFPVPDMLAGDLARLTRILEKTAAKQLIILGDLIHARSSQSSRLSETFCTWRSQYPQVEMTLIRGNHDARAGDPPESWKIQCIDSPTRFGEFTLTHYPLFTDEGPNLAGHLHPKFRMRTRAEDLKLPCFLVRRQTIVLPAFGQFIDHGCIATEPGDDIYVVAGTEVIHAKRGN